MRGAAPRTKQQPGAGPWDPRKQTDWFAFADNPLAARGPLPVDDPRVSKGDSEFGARHLLGNVWELTSTFWDLHPNLRPRPSLEVTEGLFNYALVAKGGAWGSGWRQVQISTRTGKFHHGLDLKFLNRADSLGLRLVRHHQPCYDLLSHTIRHMAYDNRLSRWQPKPHAYAMRRATGADVTHFVDSTAEEGYCHIQERAIGIGMAPVWVAQIDKLTVNRMKKVWKAQKKPKPDAIYLGAMRIDVPFKAGTRLKPTVWAKLQQDRKEYDKKRREVEMRNEKKKKKKKGEALEELPPKPPAPDKYEEATVKQEEMAGVWRESELPAGEYHVVYWYGFLGLQGKAKSVPPVAILIPEDVERERRLGDAKGKTLLDPEKDRADLTFYVEEWDRARPQNAVPPQEDQSELWALSKTLEEGWPDRKVNKAGWRFRVVIPFVAGELKKHKWNTEPRK